MSLLSQRGWVDITLMRVRTCKLGIALLALSISGLAQMDHPQEVHRLAKGAQIGELSVADVEFQGLQPGTRQIAWIKLISQSAARTVKFESIDQMGKLIAPLPAIKNSHDPENGEYLVLAEIPGQAFRIRAAGTALTGVAYERTYSRLFWPKAAKPAPPDPSGAELTRFEAERKAHPDGAVNISDIDVSTVGYEPMVVNANVLGIRVWYSARFAADGVYSLSPQVFPIYEDADSRSLVNMHVLREKVEPVPEVVSSGSAKFRSGTEYRVVLEMIPDYVFPNALQNKFCIYEAKFPTQGKDREAWTLVKSNPLPVKYRVDIPGLNFYGETEDFYPQRSFYESFLKLGAFDCGPTLNNKF